MSPFQPFNFKTSEDLLKKAGDLNIRLPFADSISPLLDPLVVNGKTIPNRLAVQPMEGFDGRLEGSPGDLTFRRYRRYAEGGNGMIWFEATSIVPEGRSNPRQLMLRSGNLPLFKLLVELTRINALRAWGKEHNPFLVLQLTHSGRFSSPKGKPAPVAASNNPYLDKEGVKPRIIKDKEVEALKEMFVESAQLALDAGFDAIDIKACHGYLTHEFLSSFTRDNSRFGGEAFYKRNSFLMETITEIRQKVPDIHLAVRLNMYDAIPYPYGFGVKSDGSDTIDLSEPLQLIGQLKGVGCSLINITMGIPRNKPYIGRPFDRPLPPSPQPPEHPLEGVHRLLEGARRVQKEFPELVVVGTGYSWLRHYFPFVGAAVLEQKEASVIGVGRSSFAYPDALKDLIKNGYLDEKKVCISCSGCSELMKYGSICGCIQHNQGFYLREYQKRCQDGRRDRGE